MKIRAIPASFVLFSVLLSGCYGNEGITPTPASPSPPSGSSVAVLASAGTVSDYFPIRENVRYVYEGTGNEYASFAVYNDYTTETKVQQRTDNGGTVTVSVTEVADGKAACVYSRSETYWRENLLDETGEDREILLMEPIAAGTNWTLVGGGTRTITGVSENVDTPSGRYRAVSVVTESADGKTTDYYVKDIGLVKRISAGENYTITSSLSELIEDAASEQYVRFYYPNLSENKLYYKDKLLSFKTNDITRKVLEEAYKELISDRLGMVISEKTKINSLYLNSDGMVYLDLSTDFTADMNAGTSYEAMVLQCIANTFGTYYGADRVVLTIDGGPYESGHIILGKGDFLTVRTNGSIEVT